MPLPPNNPKIGNREGWLKYKWVLAIRKVTMVSLLANYSSKETK